jgi:hypothetical protein
MGVFVEQPFKVTNQPGSWNVSQVAVNTLEIETESWSELQTPFLESGESESWTFV